jgi:dTDP-4-dehydrorhamnose 3,5-epimerase
MNREMPTEDVFRAIHPTGIDGCLEIVSHLRCDARGRFVKTFHAEWFRNHGLQTEFVEQYYSSSARRVLRGLHFQKPPAQHVKLVYCVDGEVLDAIVDLRPGSSTYGRHILVPLSAERANMLYLPGGVAHGFYVLSDMATLVYSVSSVYDSVCDAGIHWASAGIDWPDQDPIVSERDAKLPSMAQLGDIFRGLDS